MSDSHNAEGEGSQRILSFYCPFCKNTLSESFDQIGEVCRCAQCNQDCLVPKKKLSISGDLPKGIKLPTKDPDVKNDRLSISNGHESPEKISITSAVDSETVSDENLDKQHVTNFQVVQRMAIGLLVILSLLGGGFFVHTSGFLENIGSPATARSTKPDEEIVFTKIDVAFERIQKAILSAEIKESDTLALNMLLEMAETDETMNKEIAIFKTGIEKREQSIQRDLNLAADATTDLASYYQKWNNYIKTLFEQKIQQASDAGKQLKIDWLLALLDIIERAPENPNLVKPFVLDKIRERGRIE